MKKFQVNIHRFIILQGSIMHVALYRVISSLVLFALTSQFLFSQDRPARAILLVIDGLHWQAPERLNMPNFQTLAEEGAYYPKAVGALPYHPKTRDYGAMHTGSIPNPVMLAGSLYVSQGQPLVQDIFYPEELTAHVTNSRAYASLDQSNAFTMIYDTKDDEAIDHALELLNDKDIRFMRIHLQDTGSGGWKCALTEEDVPWKQNIWAEDSPYIAGAEKADQLLGTFIQGLQQMNKWDDTMLIVTADHGNAPTGAHPVTSEDSWLTPLVILGPGIEPGTYEHAEHIDIVPTIAKAFDKAPPNQDGATGRVLQEIYGKPVPAEAQQRKLERLNRQILEYLYLTAELRLLAASNPAVQLALERAEDKFYGLERFTEWPQQPDIDTLMDANRHVIENLKHYQNPQ